MDKPIKRKESGTSVVPQNNPQSVVNIQSTSSRVPETLRQSNQPIIERSISGNTEDPITLSIEDLLKPSPILNSRTKNNFKIILEIKNLYELSQLQKSFPNQLNTNFLSQLINQTATKPKFFDAIQKFDLGKLDIDNNKSSLIDNLLMTICANLEFLPNFTSLTLGHIGADIKLPDGLKNLTSLTIGNILSNTKLILPNLNNLLIFSIGAIWASTSFSNGFNNLTTLIIEYIGANFTLSNLPNLSTLTIKEIRRDATFKLLNPLPNLKILTIEKIWPKLTLGSGLNNLETLIFKFIGTDILLSNDLNNLKTLSIEDIKPDATLTLPNELHGLEILSIGTVRQAVTIKFPSKLNNLSTIIIEEICNDAILELSSALNSLTNLTIKRIGKNVNLKLPATLNNLQNLTIEELGGNIFSSDPSKSIDPIFDKFILNHTPGTTIKLPDSLPSLKNFSIGKIAPGSTIIGGIPLPLLKDSITARNDFVLANTLILIKKFIQILFEAADETFFTFTARRTTFFQNRIVKIMPTDETLKQKVILAMDNKFNTIKWSTFGICLGYIFAGWFGITIGALVGATYGILTTKEQVKASTL